jgi:hypothetical protein
VGIDAQGGVKRNHRGSRGLARGREAAKKQVLGHLNPRFQLQGTPGPGAEKPSEMARLPTGRVAITVSEGLALPFPGQLLKSSPTNARIKGR